MNKSMGDDMKNEGLLIKGSNDYHLGQSRERGNKFDNRGKSRSKFRSRKDVECYYCHEKGRFKKYCKKFEADQKEEKSPENTTMTRVATENNTKLLSVSSCNKISDSWILDPGCTFHVCANKDWFDTYEKKNGGEVLKYNIVWPMKILNTYNINIRMVNGGLSHDWIKPT